MIRQSFNDGWSIVKAGGFFDQIRGGGATSTPVELPHDAMIHETPNPDDVSGGQTGFYPGGQYTYVKTFTPPSEWTNRDVFIEFEGVYMTAMVYINGCHAATNLHGYGGFLVKADPLLRWGVPNEIKVIANNPTPNSRWYSGSGIYRNVSLMVGGDVHILPYGVRATTRLAAEDEAILDIETRLVNLTRSRQGIQLKTMLSHDGEVVKEDVLRVGLFSQDEETLYQSLHIDAPKLWSPDAPNLYDLTVEVLRGDEVLDSFTTRVGLRTLTLDIEHGLRINGVPVKQRGACIHHDNGVIGAATFAAAELRRARQLKAAGFNAIRSAHHPMSPEMLDACDAVGLMVMDELSDMWYEQKNKNDFSNFFDLCWEEQIARMVDKDYNHPCVVLYSTGNEIIDLGHETGARINRRLCNRFRALDPTRFTVTAVNGLMNVMGSGNMERVMGELLAQSGVDPAAMASGEGGVGGMNMIMKLFSSDAFAVHPVVSEVLEEPAQAADIAGYNYLTGRHGALERELHPNKTVLGTETYPADIVRLWRTVEDNPHVLGDYTWTGYDYLGEAGCGVFYYDGTLNFSSHFPDRAAYIGDIDLIGTRRPISYLRETVFGLRDAPYIAVIRVDRFGQTHSQTDWMYKDNIASWTWPGFEGRPTEAEVYSTAEEVELFLNGTSLGRKPAGREHGFTAVYPVTYAPGELLAVAYTGGVETGRFALRTAGEESRLRAEADKPTLRADGADLAFITARLTDAAGIDKPFEKRRVSVSVEGAGMLQGFGSADPQPTASYDDTAWDTWDGRVMAVVRSNRTPGEIRVTFAAEGLEAVEVRLRTE